MLGKIKGAIFDMDGTLVDSLMLWNLMWDHFGERFLHGEKFCPSDAANKAVRTMTLKDAMHYLYSQYPMGESGDELFEIANNLMINFYENEVQLKGGVLDFLKYCHEKGIKMCIASATDKKLVNIAMKHCGVEKYFAEVFSCAEVGKGKEEPDVYLKALEYLGTSKEETCVFEDSHIAIQTADEIGMQTVGIYDQYNYGQEEIKKIATEYIACGETLKKLME